MDQLPEDKVGRVLLGPQTLKIVETVLLRAGQVTAGLRVREVRESGGKRRLNVRGGRLLRNG